MHACTPFSLPSLRNYTLGNFSVLQAAHTECVFDPAEKTRIRSAIRSSMLEFFRETWPRESIEFYSLFRLEQPSRACVCTRVRVWVRRLQQRFVSQFLIGLEALRYDYTSAGRRCTGPNLAFFGPCCLLLRAIPCRSNIERVPRLIGG